MATVTEAGGIIYPPVPAFYAMPKSIEEMVDHTLARVLELFDIDAGKIRRWTGERERPKKREKIDDERGLGLAQQYPGDLELRQRVLALFACGL